MSIQEFPRIYQLPREQYGFWHEVLIQVGPVAASSVEAYLCGKNKMLAEISQPEYALTRTIANRRGIELPARMN